MSQLLQTILFGTFTPPDVQSKIHRIGDDQKRITTSLPVKDRSVSTRTAVVTVLTANADVWLTMHDVAHDAGIHKDTAMKVLNQLASEHLVLKRRAKVFYRGNPSVMFKWMKRNA